MAKKGNAVNLPGWLSSLISIMLVLGILMIPAVTANWIQKIRAGEGRYSFNEEICYDLDNVKDLDNSWIEGGAGGQGAMQYQYWETGGTIELFHTKSFLLDAPLEGTTNGYAVNTVGINPGDVPAQPGGKVHDVQYLMNLTKKDILDNDITSIDIYLNISGFSVAEMQVFLRDETKTISLDIGKISVGNLSRIEIEVTDLLLINGLGSGKKLLFVFHQTLSIIAPGSFVVFDMQWNCITQIKTPSLTQQAYVNVILSVIIFYAGIVFAPEFTVKGSMKRFFGSST